MLKHVRLENVGPTDRTNITFAPRVNILTGDNGLGKSFILDIAWWVLTRTWRDLPALPTVKTEKAEIEFSFSAVSTTNEYTSRFESPAQSWSGKHGRPANPGLVLYASVDGGFSVWDPARNYWRKKGGIDVQERPPAYIFRPTEVWDGITSSSGSLCNGLIRDWQLWQKSSSVEFRYLTAALAELSPPGKEKLVAGDLVRISLNDVRDIPTLRMPYGQDVPVLHASAGMRRVIALAYLLVWAWSEHCRASALLAQPVAEQIIFLVDEIECHLHPQWQRSIMGSLLSVIQALEGANQARVQVIATTHSPLLLASLEPFFDGNNDAWFDMDLVSQGEKAVVEIRSRTWEPHGDASSWLTSEAFDLREARSREAEEAIGEASRVWTVSEMQPDEIKRIHAKLRGLLKDTDRFWVRWLYFVEKKGITL